ncbi:uncharacterized protein LOC121367384 isoform X2 [Gigantopelta aegis]|uniref:uncharacterized protein LOC121367384 isoform X1 n=1 Tax=Gigantopelta aegis TaxID=1735272 RepID=UPI001B88CF24|nr:uncharacterized protein LOC121367384 isoform X1 [Gigantopelta aegis]XP_041347462.1 uncharacterized protein LOC121367384 isoform X2 [Gigantopelta aegis]
MAISHFLGLAIVLSNFWIGYGARQNNADVCVCSVTAKRWVRTYDDTDLVLQLPCTYRLTEIEARSGCNMVVSATTDSLFGFGTAVDLKGLQFSVHKGQYGVFGTIDDHGITKQNTTTGHSIGFSLPVNFRNGDLDVLCYMDDDNAYNIYVPLCDTVLRYHSNGFALVGSLMGNARVGKNLMCGNCDGVQNELTMLPYNIADNVHSLEDLAAAKLYYTSLQISGDSRRCIDYKSHLYRCYPRDAVSVLKICSRVLTGTSEMGQCLRTRAGRQLLYNTFFECVKASCRRRKTSGLAGCLVIKNIALLFTCYYPHEMKC